MEQQQEDENSWMEKRKAALGGEALCRRSAVFARLFRSATLHSKGGQKHSTISLLLFLPKMGHIYLQRRVDAVPF